MSAGPQGPFAGAAATTEVLSGAGSVVVTPRSTPRPMGPTACLPKARCPMLEPYAVKVAGTVLRGGSGGNATPLPDRSASVDCGLTFGTHSRPGGFLSSRA